MHGDERLPRRRSHGATSSSRVLAVQGIASVEGAVLLVPRGSPATCHGRRVPAAGGSHPGEPRPETPLRDYVGPGRPSTPLLSGTVLGLSARAGTIPCSLSTATSGSWTPEPGPSKQASVTSAAQQPSCPWALTRWEGRGGDGGCSVLHACATRGHQRRVAVHGPELRPGHAPEPGSRRACRSLGWTRRSSVGLPRQDATGEALRSVPLRLCSQPPALHPRAGALGPQSRAAPQGAWPRPCSKVSTARPGPPFLRLMQKQQLQPRGARGHRPCPESPGLHRPRWLCHGRQPGGRGSEPAPCKGARQGPSLHRAEGPRPGPFCKCPSLCPGPARVGCPPRPLPVATTLRLND